MPFKIFDRVQETTTTTGTGNISLGGAMGPAYQAFNARYVNADTFFYAIFHTSASEWEVGIGTWNTGNTVSRTSVLRSSNADAAVNFSAGTKVIFVTNPADGAIFGNREGQTVTGGANITSKDLGTISSGTVTPDPGNRALQHYTNGGAHTLAPSANAGACFVDITNNGSAGAITTSGFTKVTGDAFTTTNGNKFRCHISVGNGGSLLSVQALQ